MAHRTISSLDRVDVSRHAVRGAALRIDLRCRRCGYGIVVSEPPTEGCPMCHGDSWIKVGNRMARVGPRAGARLRPRGAAITTKETA